MISENQSLCQDCKVYVNRKTSCLMSKLKFEKFSKTTSGELLDLDEGEDLIWPKYN